MQHCENGGALDEPRGLSTLPQCGGGVCVADQG